MLIINAIAKNFSQDPLVVAFVTECLLKAGEQASSERFLVEGLGFLDERLGLREMNAARRIEVSALLGVNFQTHVLRGEKCWKG